MSQDSLGDRGDLRNSRRHRGRRLHENLHYADAVQGLGFDMFDIVDRSGEYAFVRPHDVGFHVLWRKTVIVPDYGNDRYVDAREDVLRRTENGQNAGDQNENGQDDKGVRSTESEVYDPHNGVRMIKYLFRLLALWVGRSIAVTERVRWKRGFVNRQIGQILLEPSPLSEQIARNAVSGPPVRRYQPRQPLSAIGPRSP